MTALKDRTNNCSSHKAEASLERLQYISWIKGETDVFLCHLHSPVFLRIMDLDSRAGEKNAGL